MRILLLFLLSFLFCCQYGYSQDKLEQLLLDKKYQEATEEAYRLIKDNPEQALPYFVLGKNWLEGRHNYDSAYSYFITAIQLDGDHTYISGWSYAYAGVIDVKRKKIALGRSELNTAIKLNKTENSVTFATRVLNTIDEKNTVDDAVKEEYPFNIGWVRYKGKNIDYYFFDTVNKQDIIQHYIDEHEQAYEKINGVFEAVLPEKMRFYIWYSNDTAKKYLKQELGFTVPETCVSEVNIGQTIGHEMTHTFSYWAWGTKPVEITKFINEGVAVAFDQRGDNLKRARMAANGSKVSIADMWEHGASTELLYPVGGAFVSYMYGHSKPEEFRGLIKDQTMDAAYKIYGKERLDGMVKDFEKLLDKE